MSDNKAVTTERPRTGFASRLLTKELEIRKKTDPELKKISPADAAKYAVPNAETRDLSGAAKG